MGKRSSFPRRKADDYATPLKGVTPVLPHLRAEGIVTFVEPCAGAGNLVAHLCSFGFLCAFARDLRDGFDALTCDPNTFQGADAVVTNPPWTRAALHPMIECGATINLGTASIWMGASPGASRREGVARPEGRSWRRREPT